MEDGRPTHHVAFLSSPGMGHLIPLIEFAKHLVLRHRFSATLIAISGDSSKAHNSLLNSLPDRITSIALPQPPLHDLPSTTNFMTRISVTFARSLPSLQSVITHLKDTTHLVALVADIFSTDAITVARDLNVPPYIFFPMSSTSLSFTFHVPALDAATSCEYRDLPETVRLPGGVEVHGRDLPDPFQDRKDEAYSWAKHHCKRFKEADGLMVNSFRDLEPEAIDFLEEEGGPSVYFVGPLVRAGQAGSTCLSWLDEQPRGSVLFVSFGSGGTLSGAQMRELAMGLELSEQRFLWVVKSPSDSDSDANGAFFGVESSKNPFDFLPDGFLERTKNSGLIVNSWAPQVEVLSHSSTGGFLTHCGWNSTLESVVHGVPMIAWPLSAEQRMNAVLLVEGVKVALRMVVDGEEDGVVVREEISRLVRELMEGEGGGAVRRRATELREAAGEAWSAEGSACKVFDEIASKWMDGFNNNNNVVHK